MGLSLNRLLLKIVSAYIILLAAMIPLVWWDYWSLPLYGLIAGVLGLAGGIFFRFQQTDQSMVSARFTMGLLAIVCLGIFLQKEKINYPYATHDPGAYWNAAQHLVTFQRFTHYDELTAIVYGEKNSELVPLVWESDTDKPWLKTSRYGRNLEDKPKGISSYHGLFPTTVFLAVGRTLFGEERALWVNNIHYVICLLLMAAILLSLSGSESWTLVGTGLFALSLLPVLVFRESLSEPLYLVMGLGTLFVLLEWERQKKDQALGVLASLCCLGACMARMSGFLFLPCFAVWWVTAFFSHSNRTAKLTTIVGLGVVGATLFHSQSYYLLSVFDSHIRHIITTIGSPKYLVTIAVLTLFLVPVAVFLYRRRGQWSRETLGKLVLGGFGLSLVALYVRIILRLSHQYVEIPFVLYPFDSLVFYVGPLVVLIGAWGLMKLFSEIGRAALSPYRTYVPALLFFYVVFYFYAFTMQPYYVRYFLEFVPWFIVGFVLWSKKHWANLRVRPLVRVSLVTSVAWAAFLLLDLNHPEVAKGVLPIYQNAYRQLHALKANGKKPILLADRPTWEEMTVIMPFNVAEEIAVGILANGTAEVTDSLVAELGRRGFEPILVSSADALNLTPQWRPWTSLRHCAEQPFLNVGAPPYELATRCTNLSWYRLAVPFPPSPLAQSSTIYDRYLSSLKGD